MNELEDLAARTTSAFQHIQRTSFLGDPAVNPRLKVEVVEPAMVEDTPTLVLVTPWTLNGLLFPVQPLSVRELVIGDRRCPLFTNELEAIGVYQSVNLVADVSGLASPESGREAARLLAAPFRQAVAKALDVEQVPDRARRELFTRLSG